jgi:chorismate-pyruvate lyase
MDYVQAIKQSMATGESLAAVLEGVASVVVEQLNQLPKTAKRDKADLEGILKCMQKAHKVARVGEL